MELKRISMNILSYTNCPLDPNLGSGKTVLMFSQGMCEIGHTVEVCAPQDYETWYGLHRAKQFRQAWGSWHSVNRKIRTGQYDLLEFYGAEFWLPIWSLTRSVGRPLVVAHTNGLELLAIERMRASTPNSPRSIRSRFYEWFFRQTHERFSHTAFACADAFVALCEMDRQYVLNLGLYPPERTAVVEPGLDEEYLAIPFLPQREERVAFTGTWILRKGIDKLAVVMTRLLGQNPNLYFDVYGTLGARDNVLASFPAHLHNQIVVHPKLSNKDLANGLSKAKVFFFPTQYEGFGIALAEAMACGCAAVTTPTGFGADLHDGKEALICNFYDFDAMEHAITNLIRDENLWHDVAHRGWERVRSFSWQASIKKLDDVYSGWIKEYR